MSRRRLGWQPSRFLADRGEAERAFALAERLGSVNAAAAELGTTWPSLRKAFQRHGLGMPARNPEVVRQRAVEAARQRSGRPVTPSLDPVFVALNHGDLPIRARSDQELAERVRRAEDYPVLGARVVVELHSENHAAKPAIRAWAITRRAGRAHRLAGQRTSRGERHQADRASRTDRPTSSPRSGGGCRCPLTPPLRPARRRGTVPRRPGRLPRARKRHESADLLGEPPTSRQESLQRANDAADRHGESDHVGIGRLAGTGRVPARIASRP